MRLAPILLLLFVANVAFGDDVMDASCDPKKTTGAIGSPEAFCAAIDQSSGPSKGKSLQNVREALVKINAVAECTRFGSYAKDSAPHFEKAGFEDLLKNKKGKSLLIDESQIPVGSIIVLKKAGGCPVNDKTGHVVVKCASNSMVWNKGETRQDLSGFLKRNPKCVQGVMYNPKWDAAPTNASGAKSGNGKQEN